MIRDIIRIELLSDLCAGSGYSYAGVIDSDVVADRYGFPYIPARRIKGCMLEAARMIKALPEIKDSIAPLFGIRGDERPGALTIGNAYIEDYPNLVKALQIHNDTEGQDKISKEMLLQQFTSVRAQTAIDASGSANDNTLRFIRVVNQTYPWSNEHMVFCAEVTYPETYKEALRNILKATRSIGMDRNRGLGNVHCTLASDNKGDTAIRQSGESVSSLWDGRIVRLADGRAEIHYTLTNVEPLMISQDQDNVSETYIPGRMVLGALAAGYIADHDLKAKEQVSEDPTFRDLFLNGKKTQYLNAYITDDAGHRCIPVPAYIRQLKKSTNLVNYERMWKRPQRYKGDAEEELTDWGVDGGNQPKALTGKYCFINEQHKVGITETERQLTYHHRHGDVQLYSHLEIAEGQHFAGIIRVSDMNHARELVRILERGLQIGKSRSAQYGKCVLAGRIVEGQPSPCQPITVAKETDILVSLSAPAVFTSEGQESVQYAQVYDELAKCLGLTGKVWSYEENARNTADQLHELDCDPQKDHEQNERKEPYFCNLETRMIYGYQSVWNLRRTPVATIAEGSAFVYHITEDAAIDGDLMVGSMNLEGYGEIHIERMGDIPYKIKKIEDNKTDHSLFKDTQVSRELQTVIDRIETRGKLEKQKEAFRKETAGTLKSLTPSSLGRITLMLRESQGKLKDFQERVDSIKTDATKKTANKFAEKCAELEKEWSNQWYEIALDALIYQKYMNKLAGKEA